LFRQASVMDEAALDFEDCLHDADAWQQALSAGAFDEPPVVVVAAVEAGEVYGGEHWRPRSRPFAELTQQHQPAPVCGLSLSPPALGVETAAWHCTLTGAELPRPSGGALLPELSMPSNCSGIRRRFLGNLGPSRRAWSPFSAVGHYQSHLSQSSEHQSYARGVEILVPAEQQEVFFGAHGLSAQAWVHLQAVPPQGQALSSRRLRLAGGAPFLGQTRCRSPRLLGSTALVWSDASSLGRSWVPLGPGRSFESMKSNSGHHC